MSNIDEHAGIHQDRLAQIERLTEAFRRQMLQIARQDGGLPYSETSPETKLRPTTLVRRMLEQPATMIPMAQEFVDGTASLADLAARCGFKGDSNMREHMRKFVFSSVYLRFDLGQDGPIRPEDAQDHWDREAYLAWGLSGPIPGAQKRAIKISEDLDQTEFRRQVGAVIGRHKTLLETHDWTGFNYEPRVMAPAPR